MSEPITLPDLIKSLPTVADTTGYKVLLTDVTGNLSGMGVAGFLPCELLSTEKMSYALQKEGFYIGYAYSKENPLMCCIFNCVRTPYNGTDNISPHANLSSWRGLKVFAVNAFGTISFEMDDGSSVPSDIQIRLVRFPLSTR